MTTNDHAISPEDFRATAAAAVTACTGSTMPVIARRLAADGLLGVLADEAVGGLGLPLTYAVPLVHAGGAGLLAFPLIETSLLARAFAAVEPDIARALVAGERTATIAWRGTASVRRDGDTLVVSGDVDRAPLAADADDCLVVTSDGAAVLVPRSADGVSIDAARALALESPDAVMSLDGVRVARRALLTAADLSALVRDALVLRAAAMLGSADHCIDATVAHVSGRRQFGSALVANQAVRHRLARHKLDLEGARSALERHAMAPSDLTARSAFVHACDATIAAAEGAIQLHGGMGFTWDVPMHRHLRQIRALALQGGVDTVRDALAATLIDQRNATDLT